MATTSLTQARAARVGNSKRSFATKTLVVALESMDKSNTGLFASNTGVSLEGFNDGVVASVEAYHDVADQLDGLLLDCGFEDYIKDSTRNAKSAGEAKRIEDNMVSAATYAATMLGTISSEEYHATLLKTTQARPGDNKTVFSISPALSGPHGSIPTISNENYDEKPIRGYRTMTISYNLNAARQDPLGEALYPTTVIAPTEGGIEQHLTYTTVMPDETVPENGDIYDTKEVNLVDAYRDPDVLEDSATRLLPVFTDQARPAAFVSEQVVASTTLEDGIHKTAPLSTTGQYSLVGLQFRGRNARTDQADITDTLDPALAVKDLFVTVGGKTTRFLVNRMPSATFQTAVRGDSRDIQLTLRETLQITNKSTTVDGQSLPAAAALSEGEYAEVELVQFATANVARGGNLTIQPGTARVVAVYDANHVRMDLNSGRGKTVVDAWKEAQIVGWNADGHMTNKNRRQRGQILNTRTYIYRYPIPLQSPISHVSSTMDAANQAAIVNALTVATNVRNSNNAVIRQLNYVDQLAAYCGNITKQNTLGTGPKSIEGALCMLMRPTFRDVVLDLRDAVDTVRGKDRYEDVCETILNTIKATLFPAYRDSNVEAAFRAVTGNPDERPKVIIATDNEIGNYLMTSGDVRTIGPYLKYEIVTTNNRLFDGKLLVLLGRETPEEGDILNNGNFYYVPSLVADLNVSRRDQTSREVAVMPYNLHVNNIPFAIRITLKGLREVVSQGASSTANGLNGFDKGTSGSQTNTTTGGNTGTGTTTDTGKSGG